MKRKSFSPMVINSDNYLTEGLVHKIYKYSDRIFKVPKDDFEDFNNLKHFKIELISHKILKQNFLPAATIYKIYNKNTLMVKKYVLEEEYIEGIIKDNSEIVDRERINILLLVLQANKIKIPFFGDITPSGKGRYKSWHSYLKYSLEKSSVNILKYCNQDLRGKIQKTLKEIENVPPLKQGFFLLLDTNAGNFFFGKDGTIISMIDIDHPISGDPLYEYAALRWYHPVSFKLLCKKFLKTQPIDKKRLNCYYLHFGFNILNFELKHKLDISKTLIKINEIES